MNNSNVKTLESAGFNSAQIEAMGNVFVEKEVSASENFSARYFKKPEFACKCGGKYCNGYPARINPTLVTIMDETREVAEKPCIVSSGLRCPTHNANVGGVKNSHHLDGDAADFAITGWAADTTINYLQNAYGGSGDIIELYAIDKNYVHMAVK